jgi:branched-chain amino acid transport system substrate-binding protein
MKRWLALPRIGDLFGAVLTCAGAQAQQVNVKIGILNDMSSVYADAGGPGSVLAAKMAIADFMATHPDVKVELLSADHQNKPDVGASIAAQWIDVDKVDMILDVPNSGVALAIANVVKQKNKVFVINGAASSDLTGPKCNANMVHWTYDTWMLANGTGKAIVKNGGDTWFFLTADYAFGHALERDASAVIAQNGGKVLGSVSHPFATPDLSSFILQAQASKAKIIGIASGPPDNINAIKLGGEFGVFKAGQQMAGLLVVITDVNALGLQAAQGLVLTTSFYWDMDDKTRAWSKRFFAKMNRMPTMWQAGTYSAVINYLNAVKASGTDDPLKVAAKMRETPVEDFFSRNGRLREDNLMIHDLLLVQVKKPEDSKYPWDYYQILAHIPGDQAFGPPNPACSLVKQ